MWLRSVRFTSIEGAWKSLIQAFIEFGFLISTRSSTLVIRFDQNKEIKEKKLAVQLILVIRHVSQSGPTSIRYRQSQTKFLYNLLCSTPQWNKEAKANFVVPTFCSFFRSVDCTQLEVSVFRRARLTKCKIPARRQINIVLFRYGKLIVQFPSPYFSKRAFLPCRIQYSAIKCSRTAPFETGPMVPNNNSITVGRIHLACFSPVRGVTCFGEDAAYARVLFLAPGLRRTPQDPREWKYRPHFRGDYFLL